MADKQAIKSYTIGERITTKVTLVDTKGLGLMNFDPRKHMTFQYTLRSEDGDLFLWETKKPLFLTEFRLHGTIDHVRSSGVSKPIIVLTRCTIR